jgi:transposase-like protein
LSSPREGDPHSAGTNTTLSARVFKREAVELYRSSEKSIPKVVQELNVADESLRRWVRQQEVDAGDHESCYRWMIR